MDFLSDEFADLISKDIEAYTKASDTRDRLTAHIRGNYKDVQAFRSVEQFVKGLIINTFGKQASVVMQESEESKGKHLDSFSEEVRPIVKALREEREKIKRKANDYYKKLGVACFGEDFKEALASGRIVNAYQLLPQELQVAPRHNPKYEEVHQHPHTTHTKHTLI